VISLSLVKKKGHSHSLFHLAFPCATSLAKATRKKTKAEQKTNKKRTAKVIHSLLSSHFLGRTTRRLSTRKAVLDFQFVALECQRIGFQMHFFYKI